MWKRLRVAVCAVSLFAGSGCYHTRVVIDAQPATDAETRTVNSFAWGLVQENVQPPNCVSQAMQQVRVDWNFGYSLLTVVTLGFWSPISVQWQCAKTPPPPIASSASASSPR
ncbi:MAG TPA: hypothetical protein VK447_11880 [Myxococcaceae bacterium]|nr:hypothetical protein [Myxococcaceae bacterium]